MTDFDKLEQIRKLILEWKSKQGHDKCHYYPDIFNSISKILGLDFEETGYLPSLEEFKHGCIQFQKELFQLPDIS